ncbi:MAG: hypothetical protein ACYC0X_26425 [Pirellulaceae bacterium]
MSEWCDTETKALLQNVPPEKLAPPDTLGFTVVLLTKKATQLQQAATRAGWLASAFTTAVTSRCPCPLLTGLMLDDAKLAQFELACCDSAAVFVRDEVVAENDRVYLSELYAELSSSEEFQPVGIEVRDVPASEQGKRFLLQFLGADEKSLEVFRLPLHLQVMRKKARIMCYWGRKINAHVRVAGA